jgi:uncharacterized membrane protein YgaE (UPF0421/DUF939 family)
VWPILQTATAATAAWCAAVLLLPDGRPSFAAIAAVVCLGASHDQRGFKAFQLAGGVLLGLCVASLIVALIGSGSLQIGLKVVLAMGLAVLLGGSELLIAEAAVSAILVVSLGPGSDDGFVTTRMLEAVIGGGVAFGVTSLLFPPDPRLPVSRAAQTVFSGLGSALERLARAIEAGDAHAAAEALTAARELDPTDFTEALDAGRETARTSPRRRAALAELDRYERSFAEVDFAIRDTRVLARHAVRLMRSGAPVPDTLLDAVRELGRAVWALAAVYDQPDEVDAVRDHALRAGSLAGASTLEVMGQVRSTAVDLRRAAELVRDDPVDAPTEELLAAA